MIIYYIGTSTGNLYADQEWYFCQKKNFDEKVEELRKEMETDPTFEMDYSEDGDFMETNTKQVLLKEIITSDEL